MENLQNAFNPKICIFRQNGTYNDGKTLIINDKVKIKQI